MMPARTADTMSDAIALSSPSGRMSKRARRAADKRLHDALFGTEPYSLKGEHTPPTNAEMARSRRHYAGLLRDMAARGMRPRAHIREALKLESEATQLENTA